MNRILNRPAPLELKSKIIQQCRQFDKNNPQKKTQQKQYKNTQKLSLQNQTHKQRKMIKFQSRENSLAESIQLKQNNNKVQSSGANVFNLIKVPCGSQNQIKSKNKLENQQNKNQVSISLSESDSIRNNKNLQLPIDSLRHSDIKTASFRSQRSSFPRQNFQSRVIQTINFKSSTKKDHQSSERFDSAFNSIPQKKAQKQIHPEQNSDIHNLFGVLFGNKNPSSDSKINGSQREQLITPQKDYYPTQKKKPQSELNESPTITLPINSMVSKAEQQIKTPARNQLSPESIRETPIPKINIIQEHKNTPIHPQTSHKILSQSNPSEQIELLKDTMKNQKNLKLRDYLRLASLSNDARFDNYKKQSRSNKSPSVNNLKSSGNMRQNLMKKSSLFNKSKTAIDPQKSIALIKTSLNKKLQKSFEMAFKVIEELQKSNIIGKQYEDLVFMCNIHRLFDQNIFKTTNLLQDLYQEYQSKRKFTNILEQNHEITEQTVIQLMSPKKKRNDQLTLSIFEKILIGLKIIKKQQLPKSPFDRNYQ